MNSILIYINSELTFIYYILTLTAMHHLVPRLLESHKMTKIKCCLSIKTFPIESIPRTFTPSVGRFDMRTFINVLTFD